MSKEGFLGVGSSAELSFRILYFFFCFPTPPLRAFQPLDPGSGSRERPARAQPLKAAPATGISLAVFSIPVILAPLYWREQLFTPSLVAGRSSSSNCFATPC